MAAASATLPSSRIAYHYTNKLLSGWGVNAYTKVTQKRIGALGKPIGFWYAYEDAWKKWKEEQKNTSKPFYGYRLPLSEDTFVTIAEAPNSTKILRLTKIYELKEFLRETGVDKFRKTPEEIKAQNKYTTATSSAYAGVSYPQTNWLEYWNSIKSLYGGIEFGGELIRLRPKGKVAEKVAENVITVGEAGTPVDIFWLRTLDVPSGVIFDPATFFGGKTPEDLLTVKPSLTGGSRRRHTHRRNRHRRQKRKTLSQRRIFASR